MTHSPQMGTNHKDAHSMNDLTQTQITLEQEALALGQQRYFETQQGHAEDCTEDQTAPGRALIRRSLDSVTQAVAIKRAPTGAGRKAAAIPLLEGLEDHTLAFHALRCVIAGLSTPDRGMTDVAEAVGKSVLDEINFRRWSEQDAKRYEITQIHMQQNNAGHRRRQIAGRMFRLSEITPVEWTREQTIGVGMFLVDALVSSTQLVEVRTITDSSKRRKVILQATEEVTSWANDAHERSSLMCPVRMPMVIPPRPWTSPSDGGYLTDLGGKLTLIKTRNRGYLESLHDVEMPAVYDAVNRVQAVAWQINAAVLHVAKQCWEQGIEVGDSMPCREPAPVPTPPVPREQLNDLKKTDRPRYSAWAQKAAAVHEQNAKGLCKRLSAASKLNLAEKFVDFPAIYFPHQLDFRGRIYAVPNHLHPQADDLARGLLRFADGKPLGARGLWWLKVHIANCWGVDKVSHAERVQWVEDHMELLQASAIDPLGERFWMTADDPWQALAAILEMVNAQLNGPDNVLTRLPIPQDGTCNGLQNFSALLRDPVGGKATNLVPQDKPADIYAEVAKLVAQQVKSDAERGVVEAILVDGKINRKIVKQPVMTLPYGATKAGMRDQIDTALRKTYPGEIPVKDTWGVATYLADVTWDAIGRVVVAAVAAMDWMRGVARVAASEEYPLRWTTPVGLPVLQDYREILSREVEVHVNGQRVRLSVAHDGEKLAKRRQSSGISPNFVHSLDAAHLMRTVLLAEANGLQHFALIHDSYGVHACDTDLLHACIREAFVEQYSEDILGRFKRELEDQLPTELAAELPALPPTGTLDLEAVKLSRYFFA